MSAEFVVHMGGGAYLNSNGEITYGAPDRAQIYQAPAGFAFDVEKAKDVLKELKDLLPYDDAGKKKWEDWGVPKGLVDVLSKAAGIVGVAATALSVYLVAFKFIFDILGEMMTDSGLSPEVRRYLDGLKNQFKGMEQIQRADHMIRLHSEFNGRIGTIHGLMKDMSYDRSDKQRRREIFSQMQALVNELAVPLAEVRDQEWAVTYDPENYNDFFFASQLLVFINQDGTERPVLLEPTGVTLFDYRLGIPMLLYVSNSYVSMLQAAMPWFQSTPYYSGILRELAAGIDRFIIRMQNESLCRTSYTPEMVLQQTITPIQGFMNPTRDYLLEPLRSFTNWPNINTFAVGAFDKVHYDDGFLADQAIKASSAGLPTGPRGLFNYAWPQPSPDPAQIAPAANEQAKIDYANLQVTTGMLHLIRTAATLRTMSTPPDRSQTISGTTAPYRYFVQKFETTVKSPYIFTVGVIEMGATRKTYHARNTIRITTQETGLAFPFRYRIMLRTIQSLYSTESWRNRNYVGDIWNPTYVPTESDSTCNRLKGEFQNGLVLSDVLLYEGKSPTEQILKSGKETLRATTFDWFVPVFSPWSSFVGAEISEAKAISVNGKNDQQEEPGNGGGKSIHFTDSFNGTPSKTTVPTPKPNPLKIADIYDSDDLFEPISLEEVSLEKAERRHVKIEDVQINWELKWLEDKLMIRLSGVPDERPFQVYVVVEEFVYSGDSYGGDPENLSDTDGIWEKIHTPFAAEIVNQLYLVPEQFFEEERKALKEGAKKWNDFQKKYAKSKTINPGDPIEFLSKDIREILARSQSTATLAQINDLQQNFIKKYSQNLGNSAQ